MDAAANEMRKMPTLGDRPSSKIVPAVGSGEEVGGNLLWDNLCIN